MSRLKRNHKYYFIYRITNLCNTKDYVGFHATNKEFDDDNYFGSGKILNKAIKKYGKSNFVMKIIEYVNFNNWKERETYWIKEMKSHVSFGGYNLTWGGDGVLGLKLNNIQKQKISKSLNGRFKNKSWNERYGEYTANLMKEKLSIRNHNLKGLTRNNETKIKMSQAALGKHKSIEMRNKLSQRYKGLSWEERYGKKITEEMKRKRRNKPIKTSVNI